MIIKCDEEGRKVIEQMLDISLKSGGIKNLQGVVGVLNQIEMLPEEKDEKEKPEKKK